MLSLAQAAALAPPAASLFSSLFLPGSGQLVIVAGGGRDLTWPSELIATHLLSASRGRLVQSLFHGGARGADQAIASAADQLGWPQIACPAAWQQHGRAAGPIRNRQMVERSLDLSCAPPGRCSFGDRLPRLPRHRLPGGSGQAPQPAFRHPDRGS